VRIPSRRWERRSAIISQLRRKGETDLDLLYASIEPSIASSEFFLRRAIGGAHRQRSCVDEREVIRYLRARANELSGLSKREALKPAMRAGRVKRVP
jgi:3-methyladenine DNA glycosylase AlkD